MTLLARYMAVMRVKIEEAKYLLSQINIPASDAKAIQEQLDLMMEIVARYE